MREITVHYEQPKTVRNVTISMVYPNGSIEQNCSLALECTTIPTALEATGYYYFNGRLYRGTYNAVLSQLAANEVTNVYLYNEKIISASPGNQDIDLPLDKTEFVINAYYNGDEYASDGNGGTIMY